MELMLHCGGVPVTFEELGGFEMPSETSTYQPVGHQDLVRMAEDRVRRELDYDGTIDWAHGVNKQGNQYFGLAKLTDLQLTDKHCLSMGLRNSYDRTMSGALAFGTNCFVCDNMSFMGSMITVMRKHTTHIMRDLRRLFLEAMDDVRENATFHAKQVEEWSEITCDQDAGYETIGLLRGRGLLTPTMTNEMFRAWQKPAHADFEDRTVWSLYNAATEAIKTSTPMRALKTYSGIHKFFVDDVVELQAA